MTLCGKANTNGFTPAEWVELSTRRPEDWPIVTYGSGRTAASAFWFFSSSRRVGICGTSLTVISDSDSPACFSIIATVYWVEVFLDRITVLPFRSFTSWIASLPVSRSNSPVVVLVIFTSSPASL
ncbi:hypothetical protein D3C75_957370 [compost metagenome]